MPLKLQFFAGYSNTKLTDKTINEFLSFQLFSFLFTLRSDLSKEMRKPVRKIIVVPKTIVRYEWNWLAKAFSDINGETVSQMIIINPAITPQIGPTISLLFENAANKNNPNIPPLKIEANFHQTSKALFTFIINIPIVIPMMLIIKHEIYRTFIASLSEAERLKYR